MHINRTIILIIDSGGVGALPDAAHYGDAGANTLSHVAQATGGINLPNCQRLGLGNITPIAGVPPTESPLASWGALQERSPGKDTTTGHWELMGLVIDQPFPTYPNGFPDEIIEPFKQLTGRGVLGNKAASGTEIIQELGELHQKTGDLIVYTSADSVFQIAAHEETVPLEQLYEYSRIARGLLVGEHTMGRVIARPFIGPPGNYRRVGGHRHDYAVQPFGKTLLDLLQERGHKVHGIGKIADIFANQGITDKVYTGSNAEGMERTRAAMREKEDYRLIFTNLVDFDMVYGHRRNAPGYKLALEEFDGLLGELMEAMVPSDLLVISADHGCDPTFPGSDHTREQVPLLMYTPSRTPGTAIGIRSSFADLGKTLADMWRIPGEELAGTSFYRQLAAL